MGWTQNFLIVSDFLVVLQSLYETSGSWHALVVTFWKLPLIYLAMMVVRGLCICLLNPIFRLAGSHMSAGEILFSTVGGLRGAISLILAQMLVTQSHPNAEQKLQQRVQAQVCVLTFARKVPYSRLSGIDHCFLIVIHLAKVLSLLSKRMKLICPCKVPAAESIESVFWPRVAFKQFYS